MLEMERLMKAYYSKDAEDDRVMLELSQVLAQEASEVQRKRCASAIGADRELAEALLLLSSMEPQAPKAEARPKSPDLFKLIGPVMAVAALVLVLLISQRPKPPQLVSKGGAQDFAVAVQRGPRRFLAKPGARLLTGDQLGFFYSVEHAGYLALFNRDQSGRVVALYPASEKSAAVQPGVAVPLPDGAVVEHAQKDKGCEWFVAVFSSEALKMKTLVEGIQSASAGPGCALELKVPEARALKILPLTR